MTIASSPRTADRGAWAEITVIKAAMDLVGLTSGALRPPMPGLEPDDHAEFIRILQEMELLP
jgi:dihydrodipicolinate synthase/N-acetylneuraminate lyase